jgi:hypothetical protein
MTQFWFNTKTKQVEVGPQSLSIDRVGPFNTYEDAVRAEEIIAQRARKIAEEDSEDWERN